MSESGSPSDEGSPSSSSRFELAMLEFLGPLLESCTKETLDDFYNCQTLANIGSSSFISMGEWVVFDAMPIFRSEFTADLLEKNLLDSERQLEALRQSCSILRSVGMRLMECGLGEPSFHQWRYCYKMRPVKACPGYAKCACRSEREHIVFGKKTVYCTWKNRWCFLYNDWEYVRGVTPERRVLTDFQTVLTRGNIKLSGQELADVEKVLKVPKEDRHLGKLWPLFQKYGFQPLVLKCQRRAMEKVSKKGGTSTKEGKASMLVPVDDILFHKRARKHRVRPTPRPKSQKGVFKITASKKAEAEAIGYATAIVAGDERRLLHGTWNMCSAWHSDLSI
ncbi:GRIP domain-containing protein RUD3-like [Pyrus ussuriensis x Pyrus communis]|uniref:GRIP domain-containing protein RUD3-like n=1 Tax=Pyrus ussuriensis x Pyrus communis TaxID=2448454 RepID=A0A5N5HDX0_9ROSA|nr:GRIP domain-containing protein RUD3-like [Pyrus ussuriensis x Pyrus communis]